MAISTQAAATQIQKPVVEDALKSVPENLQKIVTDGGAKIIAARKEGGGFAPYFNTILKITIASLDDKAKKEIQLGRANDVAVVEETVFWVKAHAKTADPKPMRGQDRDKADPATQEHLALIPKAHRETIKRAGLIITAIQKIDPKNIEEGLFIWLADPGGKTELSIRLDGGDSETDRLNEIIIAVKVQAKTAARVAAQKAGALLIPQQLLNLANEHGVQFAGQPESLHNGNSLLIIQGKERPNIMMNFEYTSVPLGQAKLEEFARYADRVAADSRKPDAVKLEDRVITANEAPPRPKLSDIPAAFHTLATEAGVRMTDPVMEYQQIKVTLVPVAITVTINDMTGTFPGDEIGRGIDFIFKGKGRVDASESEMARFEAKARYTKQLITTEIEEALSAQVSRSFIGQLVYAGNKPSDTPNPEDRQPDSRATSFERFQQAIHDLARRSEKEPPGPASHPPKEALPEHFLAASLVGVSIREVEHKNGRLHKVQLSETPGIIVTAGFGPDQRTFKCDGGVNIRTFTFDPERNDDEFERFVTFAKTLFKDAKAEKQNNAQWLLTHKQRNQYMRDIPTPPRLVVTVQQQIAAMRPKLAA